MPWTASLVASRNRVKLELHDEAELEITEACDFYDSRRTGLAQEFLLELRHAFDLIQEAPERWPHWSDVPLLQPPIRRILLDHFPYAIGYQVYPDRIVLLKVAHTRRQPLYWIARTD